MRADELEALARAAAARAQQLGGAAIWRGGQPDPQIQEYDAIGNSSLYANTLYQPTEPLALIAGNLARGLLARARQDARFAPDFTLVEPSVRLGRKDSLSRESFRDARGQRHDMVNRGKDGRLSYPNDTPTPVRHGWVLASSNPVQEGAYKQGINTALGQHANHSALKEVGIMLDTEGNLVMYAIPKLPGNPQRGSGRYDAAGDEIMVDVSPRAHAEYVRGINPYEPHLFEPGHGQPYHFRGTNAGVIPVDQLGTIAGNELIANITETAAGGERSLEQILWDFAAAVSIDPMRVPPPPPPAP